MKKNLLLSNIMKKVRRARYQNQWCGNLRPDEILTIIEAGAKPTHGASFSQKAWMELRKAMGECSPSWFYFIPSKEMERKFDPPYFNFEGLKE
jgi:hypothetical protein